MTLSRRALLAGLAALPMPVLAQPAWAADKETFVKLQPIALEFWDQAGIFHMVNMDLSVVFVGEGKIDKVVGDKIAQALSAMPWEEFIKGNPAATIKAVAFDIIKKEKGGDKAREVLVIKLMTR